MTHVLKVTFISIGLLAAALTTAITFGGPGTPKPLASINAPFKSVDFSDLPPLLRYKAADGTALAYRAYTPHPGSKLKGNVVLVHGSSGSSNSMHVVAKALASAGYSTYALDIRGHGASGPKGTIAYVGQLEDDLASFVQAVPQTKPSTLLGFSSGGGFVLRFAGSARQDMFDRYVLLSPFLGSRAPSYRPNSGGWVDVGIPRIVGLMALNRLGVHAFNDLPVINFALDEASKKLLTPTYSFALATNFGPQQDVEANIKAVHQAVRIVAGASDEAFVTDKLEGFFRQQGQAWPVALLPGIDHIGLTLNASAVNAIVAAVDTM
jgi:alpha-beta hydrolase superfamily lysophospholipase